jgi:uncharacterized protein YecT (DUF1311 family)
MPSSHNLLSLESKIGGSDQEIKFRMSTISRSLFLALLLSAAGGSVIASDSAVGADFSNYVVSWSGDYLFATIDTHDATPVHRVFVIETAHPDQRTAIGDDYESKGFAGVYCSKDEQWLCVNVAFPVHRVECHVFKHVGDRRFDEVTTPDINAKAKLIFENTARSGTTFDAVYGQYWKEDLLVLFASGRQEKHGDFYDDEMFLQYDPAKGIVSTLSKHFVSPMGHGADERQDPAYQTYDEASTKAQEESLDHQLNTIYHLLQPKLAAAAAATLASEQKQWELARDKQAAGYERDSFIEQRINLLAAKFLALR